MVASIDTVRRLHALGLPCKAIARTAGQSYSTTYRQMRAVGIMRQKPQLPREVRLRIEEAINAGQMCYAEIARQNYTNKSTVMRIAQRMAIEAEQIDQWGSDVEDDEIVVERLKNAVRCHECGRLVVVSPCVACAASRDILKNATQGG